MKQTVTQEIVLEELQVQESPAKEPEITLEALLEESTYVFDQTYSVTLNFIPGSIRCGSRDATTFNLRVKASSNKLTAAGYVIDNYIVSKTVEDLGDSKIAGSCEQIATYFAAKIQESNWDLNFIEVSTDSDNHADIRFRWKNGMGLINAPDIVKTSTAPTCPRCGSVMNHRKNRVSGNSFWGCSNYPACKKTIDYEAWKAVIQELGEVEEEYAPARRGFAGCG